MANIGIFFGTDTGRTRLSIDVRTVCPGDVGPHRVDDRSRGRADYQPLR